jgi:hypothetical protein
VSIRQPEGKLGVLTPGLGAVATTFIAGVESVRRGLSRPIGSLTQMATIRLGKRTEQRSPLIRDFAPLAALDDLVFGPSRMTPLRRQKKPASWKTRTSNRLKISFVASSRCRPSSTRDT